MTYIKTFLAPIEELKSEYLDNPEKFVSKYKKYDVFIGSPESSDFIYEKLSFKFD